HPLLPHRLRAFDVGVYRLMMTGDPVTDREYIDSFFRARAYNRDIDGVDKLRCCTVIENNDGESAVNAGIYAEDLHVIISGRDAASAARAVLCAYGRKPASRNLANRRPAYHQPKSRGPEASTAVGLTNRCGQEEYCAASERR